MMKRTILVCATVCFARLWGFPLPIASAPMVPENGFWISQDAPVTAELSYLGSFAGSKWLKQKEGDRRTQTSECVQGALITCNIIDRVEPFGFLGRWKEPHGASQFAYGVGGNALIANWDRVLLALAATYFRAGGHSQMIKQWQVGATTGVLWRYCSLIGGLFYRNEQQNFSHIRWENARSIGPLLAVTAQPRSGWMIRIQGQFVVENSVSVEAKIRF